MTSLLIDAQTLISEGFETTTFLPTGWTAICTIATRPWQATPEFADGSTKTEKVIKD